MEGDLSMKEMNLNLTTYIYLQESKEKSTNQPRSPPYCTCINASVSTLYCILLQYILYHACVFVTHKQVDNDLSNAEDALHRGMHVSQDFLWPCLCQCFCICVCMCVCVYRGWPRAQRCSGLMDGAPYLPLTAG